MGKPDMLSRRSDHGSGTEDNQNLTLLTLNFFVIRALEGLQAVGEERDILREIRRGMEVEEQEEVVVMAVKELKKSPAKSVRSLEWSLDNGLLYYRGKVYVPRTKLRCQILTLLGDTPSCTYPFIYPIYYSYFTFISLCLHICLLLFGYDLTLSCSQYTLLISLLLEPPCLY